VQNSIGETSLSPMLRCRQRTQNPDPLRDYFCIFLVKLPLLLFTLSY